MVLFGFALLCFFWEEVLSLELSSSAGKAPLWRITHLFVVDTWIDISTSMSPFLYLKRLESQLDALIWLERKKWSRGPFLGFWLSLLLRIVETFLQWVTVFLLQGSEDRQIVVIAQFLDRTCWFLDFYGEPSSCLLSSCYGRGSPSTCT